VGERGRVGRGEKEADTEFEWVKVGAGGVGEENGGVSVGDREGEDETVEDGVAFWGGEGLESVLFEDNAEKEVDGVRVYVVREVKVPPRANVGVHVGLTEDVRELRA